MRPNRTIALVERSSFVSLTCVYVSLLILRDRNVRKEFTESESEIVKLVQRFRIKLSGGVKKKKTVELMSDDEANLILLPQFLSMVSNDSLSGNELNNLLRLVHKYPLLEFNHDKLDGLFSLRKQAINAAEKYLGVSSQASVEFTLFGSY